MLTFYNVTTWIIQNLQHKTYKLMCHQSPTNNSYIHLLDSCSSPIILIITSIHKFYIVKFVKILAFFFQNSLIAYIVTSMCRCDFVKLSIFSIFLTIKHHIFIHFIRILQHLYIYHNKWEENLNLRFFFFFFTEETEYYILISYQICEFLSN